MVFPMNFLILFAVCMVVSAIGFKNYVWFISLGYGFSIAAEGLAMLVLYGQSLTSGTILCCVLFILSLSAANKQACNHQDSQQECEKFLHISFLQYFFAVSSNTLCPLSHMSYKKSTGKLTNNVNFVMNFFTAYVFLR